MYSPRLCADSLDGSLGYRVSVWLGFATFLRLLILLLFFSSFSSSVSSFSSSPFYSSVLVSNPFGPLASVWDDDGSSKAAYAASMSPVDELEEEGAGLGAMAMLTGLGLLAGFLWT